MSATYAGIVASATLGTVVPIACSLGGSGNREKTMTRSARIGLAMALLLGGTMIAMAQNGPPTGGYPPARWNPNLYGYYGYHHRHYGYHHRYYAYYPRYRHHRHWYRY
jgi:hypothetical protein